MKTSEVVIGSGNATEVPELLRSVPRWICWRAGAKKANGKVDKYPVNPVTGRKHDAFDKRIWRSFDAASRLAVAEGVSGIGFVLTGEPIAHAEDGGPLYLIGLDIDAKSDLMLDEDTDIREQWLRLGRPYMEVSPSGNGYRMFALSRRKFANGSKDGNELYVEKRFLTVTGNQSMGQLRECTAMLGELHGVWFPRKSPLNSPATSAGMLAHLVNQSPPPETPEAVGQVRSMLRFINADCSYEEWRDVVWAIEATCWISAEELGRGWSKTAPGRFDEVTFQQVRHCFKPGGIGFGTLVFKAKEAGWTDATKQDLVPVPPRFKLLTRAEFGSLPRLQWLIRGVLPATGLAAIYGPSGSGKSFLALHALCAIAEGRVWFNNKVKQTPVVYVALEGTAGIKQRVEAWEHKNGRQIPSNFWLMIDQMTLDSEADVNKLAREIEGAAMQGPVVVIDTFNAASPGADENSSQDMGRLIRNAKRLQQRTAGLVILVHHTGKDSARGLRGHSSLLAALDAAIEVNKTADSRQWTLAKSKDGADGTVQSFKLEVVPLGLDQDGESISSCVVAPAAPPPPGSRKQPPQGEHQRTALSIIEGLLGASSDAGKGLAPPSAPCIKEADAIAGVASGLVVSNPRRKRERAAAAINGLVGRGQLGCFDGWLWAN